MAVPKPSPTELPVLKQLWQQSPLSAREIHDRIAGDLGWSTSSTRKTLERMAAKGLIAETTAHGVKVYSPAVRKVATIARLAREFTRNVLDIDGAVPVAAFTGSALLNAEELEELEQMLETSDQDDQPSDGQGREGR